MIVTVLIFLGALTTWAGILVAKHKSQTAGEIMMASGMSVAAGTWLAAGSVILGGMGAFLAGALTALILAERMWLRD